jgi:glycosyltransferase involved in cell wall biosynthesis
MAIQYPKISIVTPSYNQCQYLERTIRSVLDQNYPNLEYIIIDGGSTDGSIEIIKKYEHRISYWESKKDQGQYFAIQRGFEKSTGEIMAWLNSDDMYQGPSFFIVAEIFNSFPEVKWLTGNVTFIDEDDRIVESYNSRRWSKMNILNGEFVWIQQESTFWKRSLWEQAGSTLNLKLKLASDFDLWVRFFQLQKLFTINTNLGSLRLRKSNQKSLEQMPEYMIEYSQVTQSLVISESEKTSLLKIKIYEKIISKIPMVKRNGRLKKKYLSKYDYAPIIKFERNSYKFILDTLFK